MTTKPVKLLMPGDRVWLPPPYDCVATVTDLRPLILPHKRIGVNLWEMDVRAESGWKRGMNIRGQVRRGNEALFIGNSKRESAAS